MSAEERAALIAEARKREQMPRLGRSLAREMDRDILMIRRLIDALEAAPQSVTLDRGTIARTLYDAVTARARSERANVATWEQQPEWWRRNFEEQADAVLALLGASTPEPREGSDRG